MHQLKNHINWPTLSISALSSDLAQWLGRFLADHFNKNFDLYDKAIDSHYVLHHMGNSVTHHLTDMSHTFRGALEKARQVYPDDTFLQELTNSMEHLARDLMSVSGIQPFFSIPSDQFHVLKDWLETYLHVPRSYVNDLFLINGPEVIASTLGALAIALNWNREDVEQFSEICGSIGVGAVFSANPLLGAVFIVALFRSFHLKNKGTSQKIGKGFLKGVASSTAFIFTALFVGGPVWIGLTLAFIVYFYLRKAFDRNARELADSLTDLLAALILSWKNNFRKIKSWYRSERNH